MTHTFYCKVWSHFLQSWDSLEKKLFCFDHRQKCLLHSSTIPPCCNSLLFTPNFKVLVKRIKNRSQGQREQCSWLARDALPPKKKHTPFAPKYILKTHCLLNVRGNEAAKYVLQLTGLKKPCGWQLNNADNSHKRKFLKWKDFQDWSYTGVTKYANNLTWMK